MVLKGENFFYPDCFLVSKVISHDAYIFYRSLLERGFMRLHFSWIFPASDSIESFILVNKFIYYYSPHYF